MIFKDRQQAGELLLEKLKKYQSQNPIVVALPRGGVEVGFAVAKGLHCPLEVALSKKVALPVNPEYGIGAVSENGTSVINQQSVNDYGVVSQIDELVALKSQEIKERAKLFRSGKSLDYLQGRVVILIDDGLATGVTAKAAIKFLKSLRPKKLILALPVAASDSVLELEHQVDELVIVAMAEYLTSIGAFYQHFDQVEDKQVLDYLAKSKSFF